MSLEANRPQPPLWLLVLMQAAVAAASLVVEIVAGRMLAPYLGMSLYTWTSVIAPRSSRWCSPASRSSTGPGAPRPTARRTGAGCHGLCLAGTAVTAAGAVFLLRWSAGPVITGLGHPLAAIATLTTLVFFLLSFFAGIPAPVLAQVAAAAPPDRTVSDFWFDPASARILHDDARRALGNDPTTYDVVIGDAFTGIAVPAHLVTGSPSNRSAPASILVAFT